jgi:hypothetical protein
MTFQTTTDNETARYRRYATVCSGAPPGGRPRSVQQRAKRFLGLVRDEARTQGDDIKAPSVASQGPHEPAPDR